MNDTQETTTQEIIPPMTTEIQEYNEHVLTYLENMNNIQTMNCFFLGCIFGAILLSIFVKRFHV